MISVRTRERFPFHVLVHLTQFPSSYRPIPNEKALKQFFNYVHSLCTSAARLWSHTAASRGRPLGGPRRGKPANVSRAASLLLAAHRPVRRDRTARVSRVGGGLTSRYVVRRVLATSDFSVICLCRRSHLELCRRSHLDLSPWSRCITTKFQCHSLAQGLPYDTRAEWRQFLCLVSVIQRCGYGCNFCSLSLSFDLLLQYFLHTSRLHSC